MRVRIGYGLEHADYEVPAALVIAARRQPSAPPIPDLGRAVHDALEKPIGFPALRKALTPDDHVAIVVDDHLPHQEEMLSAIVEYLIQAHIQPAAITVLYSSILQSHEPVKVPRHPGIRVEIHDPSNRKKLSYLATTRQGRRLYLNRTAVDADQLIVLAGRGYDPLLGYSGTVGALFPALSDEEAKQQLADRLSNDVPDEEPWPARREADEVAWLLGAPFMVQVIEGSGEEIAHVLGGLSDTDGEGQRLLNARWRVSVDRPADVVVAGIGGNPARHGFAELARALACADRVVKPRGRIVLLSQAHPALGLAAQLLRQADEPSAVLKELRRQKAPDLGPVFQWASAAEHANIFMLSRLEPDIAEELFTTPLNDATQVQHLLEGAIVLFLDDAHKSIAVIDERNNEDQVFMDPAGEYRQVREGAGLIDISQRGKIELVGPDAANFLHNLSTNDIRSLPSGAGCEILLTNAKGKVLAFGWVYHLPNESQPPTFWLDVDPAATENTLQHLNKYLISEQVEIADRTKEFAQNYLVGPKAREVLAKATRQDLAGWRELQCGFIRWSNSLLVQVRFHRRFGVDCFEIICPRAQFDRPSGVLTSAGAQTVGLETLEVLRVEAGIPVYGIDIDENVLAPEVGRTSQAISYTKGCYLGQETIVRIRDLGHVNRTLLGLKVHGSGVLPRGSKVFREDKEVGEVTSSVLSPLLGTVIALAYLHRSSQSVGTRVEVAAGTGRVPAEVASLPFVGSGAN